jgi:hypothetical protein
VAGSSAGSRNIVGCRWDQIAEKCCGFRTVQCEIIHQIYNAPDGLQSVKVVPFQVLGDDLTGIRTEALARLGLEFRRLSSGVSIVAV